MERSDAEILSGLSRLTALRLAAAAEPEYGDCHKEVCAEVETDDVYIEVCAVMDVDGWASGGNGYDTEPWTRPIGVRWSDVCAIVTRYDGEDEREVAARARHEFEAGVRAALKELGDDYFQEP